MGLEAPNASMPAASAPHSDACDARARKSRRLARPADSKSPEEWVTALCVSRASFLATTAVPDDPAEALRGGLILTLIMGCEARNPLDWTHAWAMLGEWAGKIARKTANGQQNSPLPHLDPTHLRARSALTDVGPPSGFPNPRFALCWRHYSNDC